MLYLGLLSLLSRAAVAPVPICTVHTAFRFEPTRSVSVSKSWKNLLTWLNLTVICLGIYVRVFQSNWKCAALALVYISAFSFFLSSPLRFKLMLVFVTFEPNIHKRFGEHYSVTAGWRQFYSLLPLSFPLKLIRSCPYSIHKIFHPRKLGIFQIGASQCT